MRNILSLINLSRVLIITLMVPNHILYVQAFKKYTYALIV